MLSLKVCISFHLRYGIGLSRDAVDCLAEPRVFHFLKYGGVDFGHVPCFMLPVKAMHWIKWKWKNVAKEGARWGAGCISWEDHTKVIGRAHSTSPVTLNVVAPAIHVGVSKVRLLARPASPQCPPALLRCALCLPSLHGLLESMWHFSCHSTSCHSQSFFP